VKFAGRDDQYVVVGTVKDLQLRPRSLTCGYLLLYKLSHTGDQLELVHRTEVDDLPAAIAPFQGRLLVGVGRYLRIYDYGKKKLLRKCENKVSLSVCHHCIINVCNNHTILLLDTVRHCAIYKAINCIIFFSSEEAKSKFGDSIRNS